MFLLCLSLIFACQHLLSSAVIFRVRLPSGAIERVEVDEASSLTDLKSKFDNLGYTNQNSTLVFRSKPLNTEAGHIKELSVTPGEFITVVEPSNIKTEKIPGNIHPSASVQLKKSTSSQKGAKSSVADIGRWRSTLTKISRQSPETNSSVRVSDKTFRILNR